MPTLGVIVGNRNFFPDHLCETGRQTVLDVLAKEGITAVIPPKETTNCGAVETLAEARQCADYFKEHREEIDGILVTLPNFGDERAIANTVRFSGLDVPVLLHAFGDTAARMTIRDRRDSFCGKMSAANNLRQYGIRYSLTRLHTVHPESKAFREDLRRFVSICNVVNGLRGARVGAIGARPAAFNTVRFSEKLLEASGISVETLDLSELLGWANGMGDDDGPVKDKVAEIRGYTRVEGTPDEALTRMAKLTDDEMTTFGGFGIVEIPEMQELLQHICENGYEHHVAAVRSEVSPAIAEAFSKYLGWNVYHHAA